MTNILARLRPDLAPIRHSRDFRLLYSGEAASSAGVMICYVALPYQAYQISRSSLVVGLLSVRGAAAPAASPGCSAARSPTRSSAAG